MGLTPMSSTAAHIGSTVFGIFNIPVAGNVFTAALLFVVGSALAVRKRVRRLMWERVGILRSRESITRALLEFEQIARAPLARASRNFLNVATLIARSALWREESRGAHYRTDFPARDDEHWRVHSVVRRGAEMERTMMNAECGMMN